MTVEIIFFAAFIVTKDLLKLRGLRSFNPAFAVSLVIFFPKAATLNGALILLRKKLS